MLRRLLTLVTVFVLLLLSGTIVYGKLGQLDPARSEISLLRHEVSLLEQAMKVRGQHIVSLTENLEITLGRASKLAEENLSLATEVQSTISELEQYDLQIRESMAWFRSNQSLAGIASLSPLEAAINANCLEIQDDVCTIKLSCLSHENEKDSIRYLVDTDTSQREDYLQDLSAIKSHGGGDCEDFSLLVNAQLSDLRRSCQASGANSIRYQGFVDSPGDQHRISYAENFIIRDTRDALVESGSTHHTMICGNLPATLFQDAIVRGGESEFGHCLLAFSPRQIQSSLDIPAFLQEATMVEPQTGQVIGKVSELGVQIPIDDFPTSGAFLFMVMAEDDLYAFNAFDGQYRWYGYADFMPILKSHLDALRSLGTTQGDGI